MLLWLGETKGIRKPMFVCNVNIQCYALVSTACILQIAHCIFTSIGVWKSGLSIPEHKHQKEGPWGSVWKWSLEQCVKKIWCKGLRGNAGTSEDLEACTIFIKCKAWTFQRTDIYTYKLLPLWKPRMYFAIMYHSTPKKLDFHPCKHMGVKPYSSPIRVDYAPCPAGQKSWWHIHACKYASSLVVRSSALISITK